MTERIINLDNSPRPAVILQIGGKSFSIRRVVTGVRQLWLSFVKDTTELLETLETHNKAQKAVNTKSSQVEQQKVVEEMERFAILVDEFHRNKLERLMRIIELLLIKNGYEFDRKWWIENGDELDYKEFIESVLLREGNTQKKTEKAGKEKLIGPE